MKSSEGENSSVALTAVPLLAAAAGVRRGAERECRLLEGCQRRECRTHGRRERRSEGLRITQPGLHRGRDTNAARRQASDTLQTLDWNWRFTVNSRVQQSHVFTCKYYWPLNQGSLDGRLISGLWKGRLQVRTNIWYSKVSKYSGSEGSAASRKGFPLLYLIHCVKQETTPKTELETTSPKLHQGYTNNKEEKKVLACCRMSIDTKGMAELEGHHLATTVLTDSTKKYYWMLN